MSFDFCGLINYALCIKSIHLKDVKDVKMGGEQNVL